MSFCQTLAFPDAEGFGKYTTGGRGGTVYIVDNLNTSGTGSFHEAIMASGPRTIVFQISGNIIYPVNSDFYINDGDITIAGETAPGEGVAIYNAQWTFVEGNVIIRHIRFRQSDSSTEKDCVRFKNGATNQSHAILDHVSLSFGTDENWSNDDFSNVTLSYCLISNDRGAGSILFGSDCIDNTFYRNMFVWSKRRNPLTGDRPEYEWVNNWVYGMTEGMLNNYGSIVDVIGNIWENDTDVYTANQINLYVGTNTAPVGDTRIYHNDNLYGNVAATVDGEYASGTIEGSPIFNSGLSNILNTSVLRDSLLATVGARRGIDDGLDSYDLGLLSDAENEVSSNYSSSSVIPLTSETFSAGYDTDNDGMEDAWEIARNGSISLTATGDDDSDGYTNIEEFFEYRITGEINIELPTLLAKKKASTFTGVN